MPPRSRRHLPNSRWGRSLLPCVSGVDPPSNIVRPEGIHLPTVGNLQLESATTRSLRAVEKYLVARAAYVWRAKGPRPGGGNETTHVAGCHQERAIRRYRHLGQFPTQDRARIRGRILRERGVTIVQPGVHRSFNSGERGRRRRWRRWRRSRRRRRSCERISHVYLYRFEKMTMGNSICCARIPGFAAIINNLRRVTQGPERTARNNLISEPIVNVNRCENQHAHPPEGQAAANLQFTVDCINH